MSNYLTGLAQLNPQVKRHDGNTTTLTLDENGTTNATMLFVNGVAQTPGIDFNVSGATLTTTSTLPAGTNIATTIQYFNTGVVNTVADDAIGLGQMASGTDGNLITYDASGNPAHVATGSDGQVLTSAGAGAAPTFETLAGGGWEYVSSVTASSSATLAFTNMASGYDYDYQFSSVLPATDAATMKAELGIAGPTYRTSNYKDSEARVGATSGAASGILTTTGIAIGVAGAGNQADEGWRAYGISLYSPADSGVKTTFLKQGVFFDSNVTVYNNHGGGIYTTAEAQTSIKFALSSGNIASGVIKQYRRPNA